jgi:hypothetical protein
VRGKGAAMGTSTVNTVNGVAVRGKGVIGTATVDSQWSGSNTKRSDGHCNSRQLTVDGVLAATQKGAMSTSTVDTVDGVAVRGKGVMGTATVNTVDGVAAMGK